MSNIVYRKIIEGEVFRIINNKGFNFVVRIAKGINRRLNKILKGLDKMVCYFPRKGLSKKTPIDHDSIMLLTYQGNYTCNPRAVADEILRQNLPYKLTWVTRGTPREERYPEQLNLVKRGSYEFYKAAASAKVFVDNTHDLPRLGVHKKNGQFLLQTWHGSLGIKRLDGDVVMNKKWEKLADACKKETDYCISNSDFETEVFHSSYWQGVPILSYGHARNDILFTKDEKKLQEIKNKVYEYLDIKPDVKLLLYAPTHKDNMEESLFQLDFHILKEALEKRFGGEWAIALRLHSRLKRRYKEWVGDMSYFVLNATSYDDIQELMLVTDIGVTDYSSWIFDYILLKKPGFILADDIDTFEKQRSFYYPLDSTPFPIATNNEELADNILNFDMEKYERCTEEFLVARGCIEDGKASQRIVAKIVELMESRKA